MPPLAQENRDVPARERSRPDLVKKTMVNQVFSQSIAFK
jgi:hypothetical protein